MLLKPATELDEFLQIHKLNYKTFVDEIPQHQQNQEKKLVDRFHDRNKYIVAKRNEKVIGMVSYNCLRPFSLDGKMTNLDTYLPNHKHLVEIRLLSILPEERKTRIAFYLFRYLYNVLIELNIDAAVISATTRQLRMYTQIGFIPFGPVVGTGEALYQPMYITVKNVLNGFRID